MVLTVTSLLEVDGCPPVKLREERDNEDVPPAHGLPRLVMCTPPRRVAGP
jgi:hypothetical protein